ncbi:hypothetical protein CsatA_004655 [Cannabis sativa]
MYKKKKKKIYHYLKSENGRWCLIDVDDEKRVSDGETREEESESKSDWYSSLLFIVAGFIDHHQNLKKKKLMAETVLSPIIEKLMELLAQELRQLVNRIDDVVDEYIHYLHMKHHGHHGRKFVQFVYRTCHFAQLIKPRYDIASVIRDIKKSLREIKERGQSYGLRPFEQGSSSNKNVDASSMGTQLGSLYIEEDDLVGIDSTSNELVRNLIEGPAICVVISIVGESGIDRSTGTIEEAIDHLRNYLKTKKYVIIFDDVWQRDFWGVIKHAFPINDNKGNRIIITTRNTSVSYSIKESPFDIVKELKPLCWDSSWELFCKWAYRFEPDRCCPEHLYNISCEIVRKCQDAMCFPHILNTSKAKFKGRSRRLSVFSTTKDVQEIVDQLTDSFVTGLFKELKLLKLLDFEGAPLYDIPKEVGHLFHLKYLNLKGTHVKRLPKSIRSLYNLQVLNLFNTFIEELPIEINKLQNFQHLLRHRYINGDECSVKSYGDVKIHQGIGCLKELQTLTFVEAYKNGVDFVKELQKLTKLVSLGIGKVTTKMGKALTVSIGKMSHLEELFITYFRDEEILDVESISSPPPSLRFISLRC